MKVELVAYTTGAPGTEFEGKSIDEMIVGMARVSSSREVNDLFQDPAKLLRHCLSEGHWSIFATCNLTFRIETSRAIGRELLRHDLRPQELSQRYAPVNRYEPIELRWQAKSNRQSSDKLVEDETIVQSVTDHIAQTEKLYQDLLSFGVARETARMISPETAGTTLYLNGTVRVWLSVLNQRLHKTAQKEIKEPIQLVRDQFIKHIPVVSEMMYNFEDAEECHIFERITLEKYGIYKAIRENKYKKPKMGQYWDLKTVTDNILSVQPMSQPVEIEGWTKKEIWVKHDKEKELSQ